jgi:hypothetical protein
MTESQTRYSIRAVGKPEPDTFLNRTLIPEGHYHSFLAMTDDTSGKPVVLNQLHFSAKDRKGESHKLHHNILNLMATVANIAGLPKTFAYAMKIAGLDDHALHLKAVQTSGRGENIDDLMDLGRVSGSPAEILAHWNHACKAALAVNSLNLPFTQIGNNLIGPANCHSGTKFALNSLGGKFSVIATAVASERRGRDLTKTLPSPNLPDAAKTATIALENLQAAQKELGKRLYETSRILSSAQRQPLPSAPVAAI